MQDEQIKLRWNALTEVIDFAEEDADHLLEEIISLWITIRGFSLAASYMAGDIQTKHCKEYQKDKKHKKNN